MRLAVFSTHPVQYYAPLFRVLSSKLDLHVFYQKIPNAADQGVGFGTSFTWDIDLLSGYSHDVIEGDQAGVNWQDQSNPRKLATLLNKGGFDAALTLGWYAPFLRRGIISARSLGIPLMVRGDSQINPSQSISKRIVKGLTYPVLLRLFSAALYVGQRSREYYQSFGVPDRRLFYSPHAIETERFADAAANVDRGAWRENLGADTDEKLVLFAGKLVDFKRPQLAVEAVASLRNQGIPSRLVVAGTGPLASQVSALSERLKVPLSMLGFVNQSQMPMTYAGADALILPSTHRETWGLVANEALASGTPIIASNEAGCSADLCDGIAGVTADGADASSFANGLRELWSRNDRAGGIRAMSDRHSLHAAANGIVQAAESIACGQ